MIFRALFACLCLGLAAPALAGDRAHLIAEIEAAGRNVTDTKRHAVTVSGCTLMTRFEYRHPAKGWVLWSRFTVFMPDATPRARGTGGGDLHQAGHGTEETGITAFRMRPGTTARYERSALRRHLPNSVPAPRGDGTTHRLSKVTKFFIQHDGPGTVAKAHRFTAAYTDYVQTYCALIG
ncbi:hypothetical protein [Roseovarius aestuariivivens]|uniref:hypothetical protein n=1 Tax=Roseovarius aestuariivivens TaxID=1888910 RepID=UPI001081C88A|nr:hypothetical protein [Roseovarius aestuariivivens]